MDELWSYRITIEGHLSDDWSDWFDGVEISRLPEGRTQLISSMLDQAALYAILLKVHQRGLVLVDLKRISPQIQK